MNIRTLQLTALFLFLLVSCNNKNEKKDSTETPPLFTIYSENMQKKEIDFDTYINNLNFVKLETNQKCLIGGDIKDIKIDEGIIFVLDGNSLYTFNIQGKFISKIGKKGNGPNELYSFASFCLDKINKQVIIFDITQGAIFKFDYSGSFIQRIKLKKHLDIDKLEVVNNKENNFLIQFLNSSYNDIKSQKARYNYGILNLKKKSIKKRFIPFLVKLNKPLFGTKLVSSLDKEVFLTTYFSNTIYKYDNRKKEVFPYLEMIPKNLKTVVLNTFPPKESIDFSESLSYIYKEGYSQGVNRISLTSRYLYLNAWAERGKLYNIAFNLNTNKSFVFLFDSELSKKFGYNFIDITNMIYDSNRLIKALPIYKLLRNKEKYEKIDTLRKIINKSDTEDNPIIMTYNLDEIIHYADEKK